MEKLTVTMAWYKRAKAALIKEGWTTKYFTRKTLDIIERDRVTAMEVYENGGDCTEFYINSDTAKTDFYNKNGGAYCGLVGILSRGDL